MESTDVRDVSDTSGTSSTLRDRWRSPQDTRRAGHLMIGVGIAGMLIAVFGMIVGWIFVGQLATASDDSLDVTLQSLDAIDDTIDLADDVLVSTADGITALAGTLTAVSGSFDAGNAGDRRHRRPRRHGRTVVGRRRRHGAHRSNASATTSTRCWRAVEPSARPPTTTRRSGSATRSANSPARWRNCRTS